MKATGKQIITWIMVLAVALALLTLAPPAVLANGDMGKAGYFPAISLGTSNSAAISADGSLYTWGGNATGALGLGDENDRGTPTKVQGISNVIAVSMGTWHCAAITADGSLYTWGANSEGQLGLGDKKDRLTPTKVPGISNVIAVSLSHHSAALTSEGSLYTWGDNRSGELGLGDSGADTERLTPTKVPRLSNVVAVGLGPGYSAAVTSDGSLYTWGSNYVGQLGDGNSESAKDTPTKVQGISNVVAVSLGTEHSAAITSDGSLYTWGKSPRGGLGLGDREARLTPTKVPGISNVVAVSLSGHSAAITADGSLYTWGPNSDGQLGHGNNGSDTERLVPTKVSSVSKVAVVSLGLNFSSAVTADGSLYTWGYNLYGQLGDGTKTARNVPAKVLSNVKLPTGSSAPTPPPPSPPPSPSLVAKPTASTVLVNGENVAFDAYNIEGNNYFKLRDLAFILNGTEKQFEVGWDAANNAITLTSGKTYTTVGGEMTGKGTGDKRPTPTVSKIYLDGKEVLFTA